MRSRKYFFNKALGFGDALATLFVWHGGLIYRLIIAACFELVADVERFRFLDTKAFTELTNAIGLVDAVLGDINGRRAAIAYREFRQSRRDFA